MSSLQTFRLFDALGAPLNGASPTFRAYVDGAGSPVAAPSIFAIGATLGKYGFLYDQPNLPRAWQVDGGASAVPRYLVGNNGGDVQAFGVYTNLGAPGAPGVGSPNFLQYVDQADVPQAQPTIVNPLLGFYLFLPSGADTASGRSYVIRSDSNSVLLPAQYDGTVGLAPIPGVDAVQPVISNFAPAPGTPILGDSTLQFDVTDNLGLFRRIILLAKYVDGSYEVVFDGDAFANTYSSSLVTSIVNGYHFSLRRVGGWPNGPTLYAFAIDTSGNEGL